MIKGIWYSLIWFLAWTKFSFHYILVWYVPSPGAGTFMSDEELAELKERMKSGPMRYEYQRIEALKQQARDAFYK